MPRWSTRWVIASVAAMLLVAEAPAHAYIDPGSGSLLYQALLAGLLGLGFTFRRTTATVSRFFRRMTGRSSGDASSSGPGTHSL